MEIRVAVVGSGVASLMAVRTLCGGLVGEQNVKVTWYTARRKMGATQCHKSKSPTTKPTPGQPFFDYGCQYMSPYSDLFAQELERWKEIGVATDGYHVSTLSGGKLQHLRTPGYVGKGGMGPMLERLTLQTAEEFRNQGLKHISGFPEVEKQVVNLVRDDTQQKWYLKTEKKQIFGPFEYVIGAFGHPKRTDPFLQTAGPRVLPLKNFLKKVRYNQFFALQLVLDNIPAGDSNFKKLYGCHVLNDEVLSFISDNSKKPSSISVHQSNNSQQQKLYLTLISTAEFARRNAKTDKKQIQTRMMASLAKLLAGSTLPAFQRVYQPRVHRLNFWQDGRPMNIVGEKDSATSASCLWDPTIQLGWCGEFCVAPCVDGAAQSGAAIGKQVLNHIVEKHARSSLASKSRVVTSAASNRQKNYQWIDANKLLKDEAGGMVDIGYFGHLANNVVIEQQ